MKATQSLFERCTGCRLCVQHCLFLEKYGDPPKELAARWLKNPRENLDIPYSCDLCGLCRQVCPEGLDPGAMCLEVRRAILRHGEEELPESFIYDHLLRRQRAVWSHQLWSTSGPFTLAQGAPPGKGRAERVFFPGCSLPGYSPGLVLKTYRYLQEKLPGTGIVLNCCGKPTYTLGVSSRFEAILEGVKRALDQLEAREILVACANCHHIFSSFLAGGYRLTTVYEVMAEHGPPGPPTPSRHARGWSAVPPEAAGSRTVTVHDPCEMRHHRKAQDAVRQIIQACGYSIQELEHNRKMTMCCGAGGCAPYGNPALADAKTRRLTAEAKHDIVSYCATCRERFSSYRGSLHLLDLAFGSPYDQARLKLPDDSLVQWWHRWRLKRRLKPSWPGKVGRPRE